jgi:cytochrome c553
MTLRRTALVKISRRKLDELGFMPSSTFTKPRTPLLPSGTSGVDGSAALPNPSTKKKVHSRALGKGLRTTHSTFLPEPAALIDERCGGWCEIALGDFCWGLATEYSHRITQKAGGRHGEAKERSDRASNALKACHHCHHVITVTPWKVDAHANGWVLEEWQEPTQVPVLYRGDLVYLDDAGDKHSYEEAGA